MNGDPYTHLIPYHEDPLVRLAQLLLEREKDRLPDLSNAVILFPGSGTSQRFRRILLDQARAVAIDAVIPPVSSSLQSWMVRQYPSEIRVLGQTERELLLLSALSDFPDLTERYGTWPLIDSLFDLFDELSLNRFTMPEDRERFHNTIEQAYGNEKLAPLNIEARLVHTLWSAWQQRLHEAGARDQVGAYLNALARSVMNIEPARHFYLSGFLRFNRAEIEWITRLRQTQQIDLLIHGSTGTIGNHPDSPVTETLTALGIESTPLSSGKDYSRLLDNVFEIGDQPLLERARQQATDAPESPATEKLRVCTAENPEQEARAIDVQVRRWLLDGLTDIGIVTNDRRLARRVRALLERADINLLDSAGWTLSTTSAASAAIHWLDCIENRFRFNKLLDCLKSPFLAGFVNTYGGLERVQQLEEALVYRYGINNDLQRYLDTVAAKSVELNERYGENSTDQFHQLLEAVAKATQSLANLYSTGSASSEKFFDAFFEMLTGLGLDRSLADDSAGAEVVAEILELRRCTTRSRLTSDWRSFRAWTVRNLERRMFKPPLAGSGVELMGFAESRLYRFQALIIAGASREHLPGSSHESPFFNEGVRHQLLLPSRYEAQRVRLADFRRLLEAAPAVVLTLSSSKDDKPVIPSPWLQRLQALHSLAYGSALDAPELLGLASAPETLIQRDDMALPAAENAPAVRINPALLPTRLSATGYQKLVDCPFSFFANYCLNLVPLEEIADELEKSDYGSLIHRILQTFHARENSELPEENLAQAEAVLREISDSIFNPHIRRQPSARGWLYLWQRTIPAYLEWQREWSKEWRVMETERSCQTELMQSPTLKLVGRLDRVDRNNDAYAVIDYKTGKAPTGPAVKSGESVQLPFYARLMGKNVAQTCALEIGDGVVAVRAPIDNKELDELVAEHDHRLAEIFSALAEGAIPPAWGDALTCGQCHHGGICRRDLWEQDYDGNRI